MIAGVAGTIEGYTGCIRNYCALPRRRIAEQSSRGIVLLQLNLDFFRSFIADVFSLVLQRITPCDFAGFAGIVDFSTVGQCLCRMELSQIDDDVRRVFMLWTFDMRVEDRMQHADAVILKRDGM